MALTKSQKKAALGLLLLSLVLLPVVVWGLLFDLSYHTQAIASGRQLIIHSSMHGLAFGGGVLCLVLIIWVVVRLAFKAQVYEQRINRLFGRLIIGSFVLMLTGYYGMSLYWQTKMAAKGYEQCPASTLLFTRVTYSAWTLNPALCYDSDVKRIVLRGSSGESEQVEQMLQQRERQQEARRQFLLQEEQLKQQRLQRAAESQ
ncbi:hypothetical protein [Rheinheimera sp. EpRS3]|jgi:hypothetical protein|uniref:hypothetical protein n=1 Tax=Rheinheimera sp. EpRS3 TaxID=1712383 RepID=UPI00074A1C7C|nr:hypothetical protein [Rheinheimera sp. EpRS3]KUM55077.1 hypothetical protein AR688_17700 [Rheinheimera sp. EpRS3]